MTLNCPLVVKQSSARLKQLVWESLTFFARRRDGIQIVGGHPKSAYVVFATDAGARVSFQISVCCSSVPQRIGRVNPLQFRKSNTREQSFFVVSPLDNSSLDCLFSSLDMFRRS